MLFSLQQFVYCYWQQNKKKEIFDIFDVISTLLWRIDQDIINIPTHEQINQYLQDSKNSIKRICVQQNCLIIIPNYLILGLMPFRIKSIIPLSSIEDFSIDKETLFIIDNKGTFSFTFDSNKRANDWANEIESLITTKQTICSICNESNMLKRIKSCNTCKRIVCVLCECTHNN